MARGDTGGGLMDGESVDPRHVVRSIVVLCGMAVAAVVASGLVTLGAGEAMTRLNVLSGLGLATRSPLGWFGVGFRAVGIFSIVLLVIAVGAFIRSDEVPGLLSFSRGGGHRRGGGSHRRDDRPDRLTRWTNPDHDWSELEKPAPDGPTDPKPPTHRG
jgi:hypothetical protein